MDQEPGGLMMKRCRDRVKIARERQTNSNERKRKSSKIDKM